MSSRSKSDTARWASKSSLEEGDNCDSSVPPARLGKVGPVAIGAVTSVVIFLVTQLSMLTRAGWSLASFRSYSVFDQLANYAIVVNGAHGNFSSVEPFTETGSMIDPHLYFTVLGVVAHLFGFSPVVVYNVAGIGVQVVLVAGLSVGFVAITRRWWAAFFGAAPFVLGTLSAVSGGNWFTSLQSHGVLWGTFGVMFAINSQSAALAIGALLLTMMIVLTRGRHSVNATTTIGVALGVGVGFLANVDTYSFFAVLFFAIFGLSAYAVTLERGWGPVAISLALLLWVLVVGDTLASALGRVAIFAVALLPALPGVTLAIRRWRFRVLAPLVAIAVSASPQLIRFAFAIKSGDPFLKYRQVATADLSVPWRQGLFCALPLLLPLIFVLLAGLYRKNSLWLAYSATSLTAWFLLAENNLWGANQEPYQLWIASYALVSFTIVPVVIDVAVTCRRPELDGERLLGGRWWNALLQPRWIAYYTLSIVIWFVVERRDLWGTSYAWYRSWLDGLILAVVTVVPLLVDSVVFRASRSRWRHGASGRWRVALATLLMASIGVGELSAIDWYHFYLSAENQSFTFTTSEDTAMLRVSSQVSNHELVLTDRCVNPEFLKAVTGDRVAFFSLGLAWPTQYDAISDAVSSVQSYSTTLTVVRQAGIGWLVTTAACHDHWTKSFSESLVPIATSRFGRASRGALTLWAIRTNVRP